MLEYKRMREGVISDKGGRPEQGRGGAGNRFAPGNPQVNHSLGRNANDRLKFQSGERLKLNSPTSRNATGGEKEKTTTQERKSNGRYNGQDFTEEVSQQRESLPSGKGNHSREG